MGYLGGRERGIGGLGGLRGHESTAREGSAAIELASIHCLESVLEDRTLNGERKTEGCGLNFEIWDRIVVS